MWIQRCGLEVKFFFVILNSAYLFSSFSLPQVSPGTVRSRSGRILGVIANGAPIYIAGYFRNNSLISNENRPALVFPLMIPHPCLLSGFFSNCNTFILKKKYNRIDSIIGVRQLIPGTPYLIIDKSHSI